MQLLREGYSECLFLLTDERWGTIVRKQTKPESGGSLPAEIAWLEDLPPAVQRYFPQVLRSRKHAGNGHPVFYDMPYFGEGWAVLSDLILNQRLDRGQELALIGHVLHLMFREIFSVTYPRETATYPDRLVDLLERCAWRLSALPAFARLMAAPSITLNGTRLANVFPLVETIKARAALRRQLRPPIVRKVHGDLHPDNILVYGPSIGQPRPRLVLLDPLAPLGIGRGDVAMDIAKLGSWLSAELSALRLGLFSLVPEHDDPHAAPAFRFSLHTHARQLQTLGDRVLLRQLARLLNTAPWARPVCELNHNWQQRERFYKALYALSMVPIVPAPQNLARLLTGLRHLHDFVSGTGGPGPGVRAAAG